MTPGRSFCAAANISSERSSPRMVKSWPRKWYSPPVLISFSRSSASEAIRLVSAALAVCTSALIVLSTYWRLAGSSAL